MLQIPLFRNAMRCVLVCFVMIQTAACVKNDKGSDDAPEHKNYNLSYSTGERHKLDVYLPAGRNRQTPFLLLIHGGAWVAGDKSSMNALQDSLMKRGIASASMNYRYAGGQVHYSELMQDVAAALEYCYEHRNNWNIRSDKYLVGGSSAGAHMSLLYAYNYDAAGRVAAVISASGPTDVTQTDFLNYVTIVGLIDEVEKMVGAAYQPGQPLSPEFAAASPRTHLKNKPTLLLHGDNDIVVPYIQAQLLAADLNTAGVPHKLVTFQGAGHDLGIENPGYLQLLLNEMELWCKTYGK